MSSLHRIIHPGSPEFAATPASGNFTTDVGWLPFHPNPSKPAFMLPPGSIDTHVHVFGPGNQFAYAPQRKYTPVDAPKEKLWGLRDHLGFHKTSLFKPPAMAPTIAHWSMPCAMPTAEHAELPLLSTA